MAKWPHHFISGKQFQKRPKLADLAFKKANGNPVFNPKDIFCPENFPRQTKYRRSIFHGLSNINQIDISIWKKEIKRTLMIV